MPKSNRIFAVLHVAALLMLTTGCSSWSLPGLSSSTSIGGHNYLPNDPGMMLDSSETEETYNAAQQARASGGIVLHVPGDSDPVRVLPLPRDGKSVRVSDLLRQSGLQSKLANMDVMLFRSMGPSPSGLRLNVRMQNEIVRPETDYALQPGDRIQVQNRAKSDALQTLLGIGN